MSGGGWSMLDQPVLVGLLTHPQRGTWLIDTGVHPRLFSQGLATRLFLWMAAMHVPSGPPPTPPLSGLFLSHFHLDHGAALLDFGGLPVITSRLGYAAALKSRSLLSGWCRGLMPPDLADRALWLEDLPLRSCGPLAGHDLFGDGSVLAVSLPGHATGQHGLFCHSEVGDIFFVADAAGHSHVLTEGRRQRLPNLISSDLRATLATQAWLRSLRERCWMVPSHCPLAYRSGPLG